MVKQRTGLIVYDREGAKRNAAFIRFLQDAFQKRGVRTQLMIAEERSASEMAAEGADFAVVRAMREDLSYALEQAGIRVFNPAIVSHICNHKGRTYDFIKDAGIPILPTWNSLKEWMDGPGTFPVVVKPAMGHGGLGVTKAENEKELRMAVLDMEHYPGGDYVIQEMASEPGKDLRVYVMGGQVMAAMLRSSEADFRSNFCLGGTACRYEMNSEQVGLLKQVMELLPFDYVGIDFLFHEGHLIFNEIEDVVGARMLYARGIDAASVYARYIWDCMYGKETV